MLHMPVASTGATPHQQVAARVVARLCLSSGLKQAHAVLQQLRQLLQPGLLFQQPAPGQLLQSRREPDDAAICSAISQIWARISCLCSWRCIVHQMLGAGQDRGGNCADGAPHGDGISTLPGPPGGPARGPQPRGGTLSLWRLHRAVCHGMLAPLHVAHFTWPARKAALFTWIPDERPSC